MSLKLCLCGSNRLLIDCCEIYFSGMQSAPTAEKLMRSRYTAYALHNAEYLLATWDSKKRPETIDFSKDRAEWQQLEIISKQKGEEKDTRGLVEFKAYYLQDGKEYVLREVSRFKKKQGVWFYLDGAVKSIADNSQTANQGLNAPCGCGSGKKFKRCCGKT